MACSSSGINGLVYAQTSMSRATSTRARPVQRLMLIPAALCFSAVEPKIPIAVSTSP